jgi:hypothetical protein
MAAGKTLAVKIGGTLETLGALGLPAIITHQTGYYNLTLESGSTISAKYTTFEYLNTLGVNIQSGAAVNATNSFHYCTFQNGRSAGTLLTIGNAQILTVYGAVFPTNAGTGSYNVNKTSATGSTTFQNATGVFSGESYDTGMDDLILWTNSACNLYVSSFSPNNTTPYVCDPVIYSVTVSNGTTTNVIVPVRVDVYLNSSTLPAATVEGDFYGYILPPLAGNASASFTFPAASCEVSGISKTWFRVDRLDEINEANEADNGSSFLSTNWQPLPAVDIQSITYNAFTNQMELTWTYPISTNNFNIYMDANADGAFSSLAGTTTGYLYSETVSSSPKFFRVKASKTWP